MPYHRDNRTGGNSGKKYGRKSFGGGFSGGDSARPVMHQAICSECDKECEVPFKPSGDKPVFCRSCFKNKEATGPRESGRRDFGKKDFGERSFSKAPFVKSSGGITKEQFEILNSKLDKILDALDSTA